MSPSPTLSSTSQSPQDPPPSTIRILTLNTWCIKYHSPSPTARLSALATHLLSLPDPPHILCLQELFVHSLFTHLSHLLAPILPFARFFHAGPFGAGLAILSAWPILGGRMEEYALGGRPSAFWRGDWYVGKGVGWVRVRMPRELGGGEVQVLNTHLHAPYNEGTEGKDTYLAHRVSEAWQIGRLVGDAMEREAGREAGRGLVVAAGDFNMVPGSIEYRTFLERANSPTPSSHSTSTSTPQLHDAWRVLHPDSSIGAFSAFDGREAARLSLLAQQASRSNPIAISPPTIRQARDQHGHTCDSRTNTWRWNEQERRAFQRRGIVPADADEEETLDEKSKRLDYVFFGDGRGRGPKKAEEGQEEEVVGSGAWSVHSVRVCLSTPFHRVPGVGNLSDHFGVMVELVRQPPSPRTSQPSAPFLSPSIPLPTLLLPIVDDYARRCRLHRRRRMTHFVSSVLLAIACWVAVAFVPVGWGAFLITVVASLGLVAGVLDGLLGGLFGGVELRRLEEFKKEVREWGREREMGCEDVGDKGEQGDGGRDQGVRDWYD